MCQEQRIVVLLVDSFISVELSYAMNDQQTVKVFWFGYMEEIVCNRDDLILNAFFDLEPMKRLNYWGEMKIFRSASNNTCKSILIR